MIYYLTALNDISNEQLKILTRYCDVDRKKKVSCYKNDTDRKPVSRLKRSRMIV